MYITESVMYYGRGDHCNSDHTKLQRMQGRLRPFLPSPPPCPARGVESAELWVAKADFPDFLLCCCETCCKTGGAQFGGNKLPWS